MKKLILNRNYVLTTTKGHVIRFVKGEPTHVPPIVYQEAIAIGAQPDDDEAPDLLPDEKQAVVVHDITQRNALILGAIEKIVGGNSRMDFTAAGTPTVKAVERELGFDVDRAEVNRNWQQYNEAQEAAREAGE